MLVSHGLVDMQMPDPWARPDPVFVVLFVTKGPRQQVQSGLQRSLELCFVGLGKVLSWICICQIKTKALQPALPCLNGCFCSG